MERMALLERIVFTPISSFFSARKSEECFDCFSASLLVIGEGRLVSKRTLEGKVCKMGLSGDLMARMHLVRTSLRKIRPTITVITVIEDDMTQGKRYGCLIRRGMRPMPSGHLLAGLDRTPPIRFLEDNANKFRV